MPRRLTTLSLCAGLIITAATGYVVLSRGGYDVPEIHFGSARSVAAAPYEFKMELPAPPEPPPPPSPPLSVDSLAPADDYPLARWTIGTAPAGWIDGAETPTAAAHPEHGDRLQVRPGELIRVHGWAGEVTLGIRMPYVLLAVCDQVVASVPVTQRRPDVAKSVHPNLEDSGWQAQLYAADLPTCESMILRAYGVAPARQLALPLSGEIGLQIDGSNSTPAANVQRRPPAIRPQDMPAALPALAISIPAPGAKLRRCADVKCEIVGSMKAGRYQIAIFEQTSDWILISYSGGGGWLSRRAFKTG